MLRRRTEHVCHALQFPSTTFPQHGLSALAAAGRSHLPWKTIAMLSRRQFIQFAAVASGALGYGSNLTRLAAQQSITQDSLLDFKASGKSVSYTHLTLPTILLV